MFIVKFSEMKETPIIFLNLLKYRTMSSVWWLWCVNSQISSWTVTELFHFRLCRSFLLVDSEMGLCDVDKEGLRMMEDLAKPYAVIIGHLILWYKVHFILLWTNFYLGARNFYKSLVNVNISHCKPVLDVWLPFVVIISRRKSVYLELIMK